MEPKPRQTRVVPESALLHFAFSQRQYVAVLNSVAYFARKLVAPDQREVAQSALAVLMTPTAFSLPSEGDGGGFMPDAQRGAAQRGAAPALPKGIESLRGKK